MSDRNGAGRQPAGGGFRDSFRWDVIRSTPRYAYLVASVAALGGMLFGYDIGVRLSRKAPGLADLVSRR